jgi:hypothetical protein
VNEITGENESEKFPILPEFKLNLEQDQLREQQIKSFEDFFNDPSTIPPETGQKIEDAIRASADLSGRHELWTPTSHIQTVVVPSDDLETVEFIDPQEVTNDNPWVFTTNSQEEYSAALAAATHVAHVDPAGMSARYEHENEHIEALRETDPDARITLGVGFTAVQTGKEDFDINVYPFVVPTDAQVTKIGFAATLAHPHEPSPGDLDQLQKMGYSMDDLLERIDYYRNQGLNHIPFPKWYNAKN